jgi:hypothetical protein
VLFQDSSFFLIAALRTDSFQKTDRVVRYALADDFVRRRLCSASEFMTAASFDRIIN